MAANTDLLKKLSRRWVGQIGSGGVADATTTTIPLSSTTNLPTDTAVVATIDRVDANGGATSSLEETIIGVVSGANLVTCTRGVEGTAQPHSAGAVVEILITAKGWNDLVDMLLVQHSQLGSHTNVTASNITASAIISGSHITASDITARVLLDINANEIAKYSPTAAAVNELTWKNAAANNPPELQATGDDTNINLKLKPKGTGVVIADGPINYGADAGANDTYAITASGVSGYVNGLIINFKANTINTGAATLNVNALGAKTIVKNYNVTLADGDIKANQLVCVIYDGTNFQLLSPVANSGSVSTTTTKARAYLLADQSIPNTTFTKITLNTEDYDPGSNFDNVTNYRFVAPTTGYYDVKLVATMSAGAAGKRIILQAYLNGTARSGLGSQESTSTGGSVTAVVSDIMLLTANDYLEMFVYQDTGGAVNVQAGPDKYTTYMAVHLIST